MPITPVLAALDQPAEPSMAPVLFGLILGIVALAGMWKAFEKAGQPGWAAIIPIYNLYVLTKVAGRPGWWVLLLLIPIVGLIVIILLSIDVAGKFGRGAGFGLGLAFLSFIFWPILGFGDATYQGGSAA